MFCHVFEILLLRNFHLHTIPLHFDLHLNVYDAGATTRQHCIFAMDYCYDYNDDCDDYDDDGCGGCDGCGGDASDCYDLMMTKMKGLKLDSAILCC